MNGIVLHRTSVLKQVLFLTTGFYLAVQGFFSTMERTFFWGEVFCFCLFWAIFKVRYTFVAQKNIILCLYLWVFFIPLYGWWVTVNFWKDVYDPIYFWRSLVPFYYGVFFFFAYRWGPEILGYLKHFKNLTLLIFTFLLIHGGSGIGSSVVFGSIWLGMQYKNENKRFFWITYFLLAAGFFLRPSGGTSKIATLMLCLLPMMIPIGRYLFSLRLSVKIFLFGILLGAFVLGITMGTQFLLKDIYSFLGVGKNQMFYSIRGLEDINNFVDENARWRLFMWVYTLGQFWKYPQGVGLGTPIFGTDMGKFFGWGLGDFEDMQFALGAHNSFLTLLGRFGVAMLIFVLLIGIPLFQSIGRFCVLAGPIRQWNSESRLVFGALVVFLIACTQAFFNMMIETPLYAAHFWFPLGLFVRLSGDYIALSEGMGRSAKQREKIQAEV